ncbi:MAG: response regulator, partial [Deltaproteobacteria bacterium]|nr:response regulator [Deltaproteobacteria bacterium]
MKKTILVLEESKMVHDLFEAALPSADWQWEVNHETKPDKYLTQIRKIQPDVLFLSNQDQKKNYQTLKSIQKDHIINTIPIILLTSARDKFDEKSILKLGVSGYVRKPFESAALQDQLLRAIEENDDKTPKAYQKELNELNIVDEDLSELMPDKNQSRVTREDLEDELDPARHFEPIQRDDEEAYSTYDDEDEIDDFEREAADHPVSDDTTFDMALSHSEEMRSAGQVFELDLVVDSGTPSPNPLINELEPGEDLGFMELEVEYPGKREKAGESEYDFEDQDQQDEHIHIAPTDLEEEVAEFEYEDDEEELQEISFEEFHEEQPMESAEETQDDFFEQDEVEMGTLPDEQLPETADQLLESNGEIAAETQETSSGEFSNKTNFESKVFEVESQTHIELDEVSAENLPKEIEQEVQLEEVEMNDESVFIETEEDVNLEITFDSPDELSEEVNDSSDDLMEEDINGENTDFFFEETQDPDELELEKKATDISPNIQQMINLRQASKAQFNIPEEDEVLELEDESIEALETEIPIEDEQPTAEVEVIHEPQVDDDFNSELNEDAIDALEEEVHFEDEEEPLEV